MATSFEPPIAHRALWGDFMDTYRCAEATFRIAMGCANSAECLAELLSCEEFLKSSIWTLEVSAAMLNDEAVRELSKKTRRELWSVETHRAALQQRSGYGGTVKPVVMSLLRQAAVQVILFRSEATALQVQADGVRLPEDIAVLLRQPAGPQTPWVPMEPPLDMSRFFMFGFSDAEDEAEIDRNWGDEGY
jgi:hypothetical protein